MYKSRPMLRVNFGPKFHFSPRYENWLKSVSILYAVDRTTYIAIVKKELPDMHFQYDRLSKIALKITIYYIFYAFERNPNSAFIFTHEILILHQLRKKVEKFWIKISIFYWKSKTKLIMVWFSLRIVFLSVNDLGG